ncbi:hypothetical protein L596_017037 [Steinernema carpocapsae]|uniref:Uncharacterized protein n=1 Tax=Steinernema carpocapsae TaxID=34508 RepID=A0A4V6A1J9_STECR|nr:hypothetical protein L596_017037 [Steinernema carpocapsae]
MSKRDILVYDMTLISPVPLFQTWRIETNFYLPLRTTSPPQETGRFQRRDVSAVRPDFDQNQTTGYLPTDHFKRMSQLFESAYQTFLLEEPDPNEWHTSNECKTSWNLCRWEFSSKQDLVAYHHFCLRHTDMDVETQRTVCFST